MKKLQKTLLFFGVVPPSELNVNQILEDTRALAQIFDLYGHLLTEDKISNSEQK